MSLRVPLHSQGSAREGYDFNTPTIARKSNKLQVHTGVDTLSLGIELNAEVSERGYLP
jgi:hypothetical protein